jgi:hypothetical protein
MGEMDEQTRLAFGLNLYNLMIPYAFIKYGIGTTTFARSAFFSKVCFHIGGDNNLLSFNDLENGILRANARHPYSFFAPFHKDDPRLRLSLGKLDCRIHFGLNCGAKSCPPVTTFHVESLDEELSVVAQSFCNEDENVLVDETNHTVTMSMLMNWFQKDFCECKDQLPQAIVPFLRGEKKAALLQMMDNKIVPIAVKFFPYDWAANASRFEPYDDCKRKATEFTPTNLLRFDSITRCMTAAAAS